jgi:hypothetical protein
MATANSAQQVLNLDTLFAGLSIQNYTVMFFDCFFFLNICLSLMKQWQSCSCQAEILATVQLNLSIRVEWKYRWWTFNFEVDQHNIWGIYSAEMREKGRVNMVQVARIARFPEL